MKVRSAPIQATASLLSRVRKHDHDLSRRRSSAVITLSDLLMIENDPVLVEQLCPQTSIPYWTQVRSVFFRSALSDMFYGSRDLVSRPGLPHSAMQAVQTLARAMLLNRRRRREVGANASLLITSSSVADVLVHDARFNRLADHFASVVPTRSLVALELHGWDWPFPRCNPHTMLLTPIQVACAAHGRLAARPRHRRHARELIEYVTTRAGTLVGWRPDDATIEMLSGMLAQKMASLPFQLRMHERLFKTLGVRVAFILGASYGPAAALVVAARRAGIVSAEYQHGAISPGHDGYNFGEAVRVSHTYRATWPDHLLTYGAWWHTQMNLPVPMTAIGNPHREARLAERSASVPRSDLLILSDGIELDVYLGLARDLGARVAEHGLRVVLRPHPLERARALQARGADADGYSLDESADLYSALHRAKVVVSEVSTGLFEAVGIAERVVVWDTEKSRLAYPSHPFERFETVESLVRQLSGPVGPVEGGEAGDEIWRRGWRDNVTRFLSAHGIDAGEARC